MVKKDVCDQCERGYTLKQKRADTKVDNGTDTADLCTSYATDKDCAKQSSKTGSECLECRDGCFFNGDMCQCTQLLAPTPNSYDFCMKTDTDSKCVECFNDGSSTDGWKTLEKLHGHCKTKMADPLTTALYTSGTLLAGTQHSADSFYCKSGEAFSFSTTKKSDSKCEATASPITNCLYHAKKQADSSLTCTRCKDGFKQKDTTNKVCEAITIANAKNHLSHNTPHECKSGWIVKGTACVAWSATDKT